MNWSDLCIDNISQFQVVENVCPGLCTERYTLSPSQLRQHGKIVRSYSPTELLRMQLENRNSVVLSGTTTEYFLDIACMGSEEVSLSYYKLSKKKKLRCFYS